MQKWTALQCAAVSKHQSTRFYRTDNNCSWQKSGFCLLQPSALQTYGGVDCACVSAAAVASTATHQLPALLHSQLPPLGLQQQPAHNIAAAAAAARNAGILSMCWLQQHISKARLHRPCNRLLHNCYLLTAAAIKMLQYLVQGTCSWHA
jgi:hypothetical protein